MTDTDTVPMTEQPIDGAELMVQQLKAEGVTDFFSIIEPSLNAVFRSVLQHDLRLVHPRHEVCNVHMAEAVYRSSGRLAVAMGTMGPGFANMVSGAISAALEGMPVLIIASQRVHSADRAVRRGRFQWTPQLEIMRPICKYAAIVQSARHFPEYVREAMRIALSGRPGPVFLEASTNVFHEMVEDPSLAPIIEPSRYRFPLGIPDATNIEQAAALLAEAKLPVIAAGTGVWRSPGAPEQLRTLAEHLGALVLTTFGARGSFPEDHPNYLPYVVKAEGAKATREADVVLAVGTPMSETLGYGRPPAWGDPSQQKLIHLDADPGAIGINRETDVPLVGDAAAGLGALYTALRQHNGFKQKRRQAKTLSSTAKAAVAELVQERDAVRALAESDAVPLHPTRLIKEVDDFFGPDAIYALDGGSTVLWCLATKRFERPACYMWSSHFGHLGVGLPYAIGAKLANPDKTVYLYTGDGAFGFNIQELETAVREQANVIVVVAADYAWGLEDQFSGLFMKPAVGSNPGYEMSRQRYDKVAKGFGCHGEYVTELKDVRPALKRAAASGKPAVVQVEIDTVANGIPPNLMDFATMYSAPFD